MSVCEFSLLLFFSLPLVSMESASEPKLIKKSSIYKHLYQPTGNSSAAQPNIWQKANNKDKKKRIKQGKKELLEAIHDNNVNGVRGVMGRDISPEIQKNSKRDFIDIALKEDVDSRIISSLLNNQPKFEDAHSYLCKKIKKSDIEAVRIFFGSNIDSKILNEHYMVKRSPLVIAIIKNDKEMTEELLKFGANINTPILDIYQSETRERSYLGLALQRKSMNEDIIKILFQADAKINSKTENFIKEKYKEKERKYRPKNILLD